MPQPFTDFVPFINTVYCIGRNYAEHVSEMASERPSEPVVFLKPNSSVLHAGQGEIMLPQYSSNVHYEAELVLLIGEDADQLQPEHALSIVTACAVGLDLTARDAQEVAKEKGLPWTKAKGFKTAACVSDFIDSGCLNDIQNCEFTFYQNGSLKQHGHSRDMLFSVREILCFLAEIYGLRRGDLVYTGTPAGVGQLSAGDVLELDLQGLVQAKFTVA